MGEFGSGAKERKKAALDNALGSELFSSPGVYACGDGGRISFRFFVSPLPGAIACQFTSINEFEKPPLWRY